MKPTFQTDRPSSRGDSQHSFGHALPKSPGTDCNFQTPAPQLRGSGNCVRRESGLPPLTPRFRALSEGFFSSEARREWVLEGALFVIIAALAAWPIVLAAQAAAALVK
ncbi:MAG: hypothetical protein ACR2HH_04110 [Chthoniobacterales bacterium]